MWRDSSPCIGVAAAALEFAMLTRSLTCSLPMRRASVTAPPAQDLFDEVARDVMTDLKLDVFPRFLKSDFYKKYIRTKW